MSKIMTEGCDKFGVTPTEFNGEPDRTHLAIRDPPTIQRSLLVNSLQDVSAPLPRQEFPNHTRGLPLQSAHFGRRHISLPPLEVQSATNRRPRHHQRETAPT
ncbi:transposase [Rhodococcus koreensis]|uniref:transposase n=1 Tax=Rhodococcus koreensis TaxID=99653 RepID=UPI00366EC79E